MGLYYNAGGGGWHSINPYVNVSGTWHYFNPYINVNGTWRPVYRYSWSIGSWGGCSVTCGGGVQSRSVTCLRSNDNVTVVDGICGALVGAKPAVSQSCNTQSCVSCRYVGPVGPYCNNVPLSTGCKYDRYTMNETHAWMDGVSRGPIRNFSPYSQGAQTCYTLQRLNCDADGRCDQFPMYYYQLCGPLAQWITGTPNT